jgi:GPH family glycoside/pentoside/hexuronide:cation symporter
VDAEARPTRPAFYSAGAFGASIMLQTIVLYAFYFYAPPAGVARLSPVLVGFALACGRVVNAVSNPPTAFWSDRLRTPWGRRRPFIALGAPLLSASYILLWIPPERSGPALFLYVLAVLVAFYFFFSLTMNPYAALLPEITRGGRGRVAMASWQAGASLGGFGVALAASNWLIGRGGHGEREVVVVLGLAALAMLWVTVAGVREPAVGAASALPAFWPEVAAVLRDPAFRIYVLSVTLLWFGTSMVNSSIVYVITVLMGLPNAVTMVLAVTFACTIAAFPLLAPVTRAVGVIRALRWTLGAATVIVPLIGAIGLRGLPFSPSAQGYVVVVMAALPLAGLLVLPNALLADIAEADHTRTREGREAMYFAVQGLILNVASAAASAALGALLALGDETGHSLGLRLIPLVAGGCTLLALATFLRYPTEPLTLPGGAPSR